LGAFAATAVGVGIYYIANSSSKPSTPPSPSNWKGWKRSGKQWWNPKPNGVLAKVLVGTKALEEVFEKWGQRGVDAFTKAVQKGFVSAQNSSGIKRIIHAVYDFEIKVTNKEYGDWRIYGYINKAGEYIFDLFGKGLGHK